MTVTRGNSLTILKEDEKKSLISCLVLVLNICRLLVLSFSHKNGRKQ